jgi:hypothetical protein
LGIPLGNNVKNKQMKANELRIGNQIYINNAVHTLTATDILTISQHELFGMDLSYCNPIKLTEDMLFRSGFKFDYEKVAGRVYSSNEFILYWDKQNGYSFFYHDKQLSKGFFYWHQLQNLYFDITGNSLILSV